MLRCEDGKDSDSSFEEEEEEGSWRRRGMWKKCWLRVRARAKGRIEVGGEGWYGWWRKD